MSKQEPVKLALMSAMPQELSCILERLDAKPLEIGSRTYWQGQWMGQPVVAVLSRVGKVAAATTATCLIEHFGVKEVVFSGVAGSLDERVRVADVVIAHSLMQHDVDASPLFPKYEIPLTGKSLFQTDPALTKALSLAVAPCLNAMQSTMTEQGLWHELGLSARSLEMHEGMILSGDQFISNAQTNASLKRELPEALAVEMECAAVAQVCSDYGVPFAALRIISDNANDSAHLDFGKFIERVAAPFGAHVMEAFIAQRLQALHQA